MKIKKFTIVLTTKDYLDVTLHMNKKEIILFALNYRSLIKNKWTPIYRVDNYHNFLHEQKLWRTKKPIKLEDTQPIEKIVTKYAEEIQNNYLKYKKYYHENKKHN